MGPSEKYNSGNLDYGRTPGSIPVHNVSRFVQMEHTGDPYCVIDF